MAKQTHTLSMTRWHTLAKSLRNEAAGLFDQARLVLDTTNVSHTLDEAQITALRARGQSALENVDRALALDEAVGAIRAALADANAKRGINQLLAEAEAVRQSLRRLDELSGVDLVSKVSLDKVNDVLATSQNRNHGYGGVNITLLDYNALEEYKARRLVFDRRLRELMDQVAELNREKLSIELDDSLAQFL